MKSLGTKVPDYSEMGPSVAVASETPMRTDYPSFYLNAKQMPEIEDWQVGEEYTLTVKVRLESKNKELTSPASGSLEVLSYETDDSDTPKKNERSLS